MGCDIHCYAETHKAGRWTADGADSRTMEGEGNEQYAHMERSFGDRNYALFGLLANGVRREWPWSFEVRGLPDDPSEEVAEQSEGWNCDGHNHSWLSLRELTMKRAELLIRDGDATALCGYLDEMIKSIWPELPANLDDHRIVFWFDN